MSTPNPLLCCTPHRIPHSCPSPLIKTFLLALNNIQTDNMQFPSDQPYFKNAKLPETILEFEIIRPAKGKGSERKFSVYYFVPRAEIHGKEGEAYRQMYPEECFEQISEEIVEERWRE